MKTRKILAMVIAMTMILSIIPTSTVTAETSGDWQYSVSGNNATITGYSGGGGTVTIPGTLDEYTVTGIGDFVFDGYTEITSVIIPNGVTSIGFAAFYECKKLTSVTIPNSVTIIGAQAFAYCERLISVTLPSGITKIEDSTFLYCPALTEISIPQGVTSIGFGAFGGCENLTTVSFNSVEPPSLGEYVFLDCSALTAINVPFGAKAAYQSVAELSGYNIAEIVSGTCGDNLTWKIEADPEDDRIKVLTISGTGAMTDFPSDYMGGGNTPWRAYRHQIQKVIIEDGVTTIGDLAFAGVPQMATTDSTITIPDSVTSIGAYAFINSRFPSIEIPAGVTNIGYGAFSGCSNLTSVTVPSGVTRINAGTFSGCTNLAEIIIPDSVTEIGARAFGGTAWFNAQPDGIVYASKVAIGYKGEMPANTELSFNNGTVSIADSAFQPNWDETSNIGKVTIPASVVSIGEDAFTDCYNIAEFSVAADNPNFTSENGVLYNKNKTALLAYPAAKEDEEFEVPDSVTEFAPGSFRGNKAVKILKLPKGTTDIADYMFYKCTNLTSVKIPDGVTTIGESAFSGCTNLVYIEIPDTVTTVYRSAFANCERLTSVTFPGAAIQFRSSRPRPNVYRPPSLYPGTAGPDGIFVRCTALTDIVFTASVPPTFNVYLAAYNCNAFTKIYVPVGAKAAYEEAARVNSEGESWLLLRDYESEYKAVEIVERKPVIIILGDIDGVDGVTIFDALEILKALVGMESKATDNPAALITAEAQQSGTPTIFDALEILKKLVGMANEIDG